MMSVARWKRFLPVAAALVMAVASPAVVILAGQAPGPASRTAASKPSAARAWAAPKTPWGDPDLQGVWTSDDMLSVPMERGEQFAGRAELTDEEFAERAKRDQQALERNRGAAGAFRGDVGSRTFRQTSRVVEPADGRIPPATPEARQRAAARQAARSSAPSSWEDRRLCIRPLHRYPRE